VESRRARTLDALRSFPLKQRRGEHPALPTPCDLHRSSQPANSPTPRSGGQLAVFQGTTSSRDLGVPSVSIPRRVAQVPGTARITTEDGCPRCLAIGNLGKPRSWLEKAQKPHSKRLLLGDMGSTLLLSQDRICATLSVPSHPVPRLFPARTGRRQLAAPQVLADHYCPSAHNENKHRRGRRRTLMAGT